MTTNSNPDDGRYYWSVNAAAPAGIPIVFVGDPATLIDIMALTWQIQQAATDGSVPAIQYSLDGGATFTTVSIGSANSPQAAINESGKINVTLTGAAGIIVNVIAAGGAVVAGALPATVAVAITRNELEPPVFDAPNPFNPRVYNPDRFDGVTPNGSYPAQTLAQLRARILIRLGFSNQATNPPPGMTALINDFLYGAQTFLWRKYPALQTRRMFRWKLIPGQRFYSLLDNDDDILANYHMDPNKQIIWAGIQDTRNVWYPLEKGIPPQFYTMIQNPWRPARYDITSAIEVYPAPDQVYFLWMRANFGLMSFVNDGDFSTIDCELLFLHALANAKAHYGQPDAANIEAQMKDYRGELVAGTHATGHYIPGTRMIPPAVRPTLITFD